MRVDIPNHIDWFTWRVVKEGMGTLTDVETKWSITDVLDCHIILDAFQDAERKARK